MRDTWRRKICSKWQKREGNGKFLRRPFFSMEIQSANDDDDVNDDDDDTVCMWILLLNDKINIIHN